MGQPRKMERTLLILSIILLIALISIVVVPIMFMGDGVEKEESTKTLVPIISGLDLNELEIISDNPDFTYESDSFEPPAPVISNYPLSLMDGSGIISNSLWLPWYSNGLYIDYALPIESDNIGVVLLHPIGGETPRYIAQNVTLPNRDNLVLVARIANIADYVDSPCANGCSDAIIKIKFIDRETGLSEIIYESVVESRDGWKNVALDISEFAGKDIIFEIGGYAGGPCSEWCAEWAAVDKFYIATL